MLHRKSIGSIVIENYIRKVKLSKAQRPKYYEWNGVTIKSGSKKLLKKYIRPECKETIILNNGEVRPNHLKDSYIIVGFKGDKVYSTIKHGQESYQPLTANQLKKTTKYILCNINTYEKVIANETQAGTPKEHIINGQAFYNQTLNPFARIKVIETIKEMYYNKFNTIEVPLLENFKHKLNSSYPLYIEMEIRDTLKSEYDNSKDEIGRKWDVGNRAEPYMKAFLDFIVNGYYTEDKEKNKNYLIKPMIEDDDRLHISSGNNVFYTPIKEGEVSSLIFHFYQDTREIWNEFNDITKDPLWKSYCTYLENNKNLRGLIDVATKEDFIEWKKLKQ